MAPSSLTLKNSLIQHKELLMLIDLQTLRILFLNNTTKAFCGANGSPFNSKAFYKEHFPPDHLDGFLNDLKSLRPGQEKKFILPLRGTNSEWMEFCVTSRFYSAGNKPMAFVRAYPEKETKQEKESQGFSTSNDYEDVLDAIDDGFCLADILYNAHGKAYDLFFYRTNQAFARHITLDDVEGKTVREVIPEPLEKWINTFGEVGKNGKSTRFQDRSIVDTNNPWKEFQVFKLGDPKGSRVGILFKDITESKLAEEKFQRQLRKNVRDLHESQQLLKTVFDTTYLAIAVMEAIYREDGSVKDFVFLRTNKVLQDMYLQEDIVGKQYLEISKYAVEMGIFDALKDVMEKRTILDQEFYFDKEGYQHWFRITARSQKNLLIMTIEDISDRKAEAEELEKTMRFKQELVQTTPEVILIADLNAQTIRYINRDIIPEAGLTKEKIQGRKLDGILPYVHPHDREIVIDLHKSLLKASKDQIIDIEIRLKLEGIKWEYFGVRGKVFQRRDENWVDEYVLLVRNINEQKSTQKALLKAEKLSIQGELARTFAHELRNPLASIGMVGEVLTRKLKDDPKDYSNYFDILKRSTRTLNELVTSLLNASNYSPAILRKENLSEILDTVLERAADRIYLAGISVLRSYKGRYIILADKEKLEIALLNLIVNASEATVPGEGVIKIGLTEEETDYILEISDNGHGMNQDQIDYLFEAFYTNKELGVGIGMSSVKNILEEHDAEIKVTSTLNKGTIFRIFFRKIERNSSR